MANDTTLSLEEQLEAVKAEKHALQLELKEANIIIDKLMDTLSAKANLPPVIVNGLNPNIPSQVLNIDGDNYRFILPRFNIGGKSYKSSEVLFEKDLLASVVAIPGQRVLEKL